MSFSASMLSAVTEWRNPSQFDAESHIRPSIWTRVKAEVLYTALTVTAVAEWALAKTTYKCTGRNRDWYESAKGARTMSFSYLSKNWNGSYLPVDVFELRRQKSGLKIDLTDLSRPIVLTRSGQDHQE